MLISDNKKQVLYAALLPFLLSTAPYVKNKIVFGVFSATTHSGRVLAQSTYEFYVKNDMKAKYVNAGKLSELVFCYGHADEPPAVYNGNVYTDRYCKTVVFRKYAEAYLAQHPQFQNIPFLVEPAFWSEDVLSGKIASNANYAGWIGVNLQNTKDAYASIFLFPDVIKKGLHEKWRMLFKPNASYFFDNMINIRNLPNWLSYSPLNMWPYSGKMAPGRGGHFVANTSIVLIIVIPLLVLFALGEFFSCRWTLALTIIFFFTSLLLVKRHLIAYGTLAWQGWDIQYKCMMSIAKLFLAGAAYLLINLIIRLKMKKQSLKLLLTSTKSATLGYIVFTILYTCVMTTVLVGTEHQRYRQYIDPLLLVILGLYFRLAPNLCKNFIIRCKQILSE